MGNRTGLRANRADLARCAISALSLFKMDYHDLVKFWILVVPLWLIAVAALVGIFILPGSLDIYYHDTYVVVAKMQVILALLLLFVIPLLVLTIRHVRSTNN